MILRIIKPNIKIKISDKTKIRKITMNLKINIEFLLNYATKMIKISLSSYYMISFVKTIIHIFIRVIILLITLKTFEYCKIFLKSAKGLLLLCKIEYL